jgi:hypothetical protein
MPSVDVVEYPEVDGEGGFENVVSEIEAGEDILEFKDCRCLGDVSKPETVSDTNALFDHLDWWHPLARVSMLSPYLRVCHTKWRD